MREYPWHLRLPTTEHYQWFKNLICLHELTLEWLNIVQPQASIQTFSNVLSPEVLKTLLLLSSSPQIDLEFLLDDTSPEDLLSRLQHAIWALQSLAVLRYYTKTTSNHSEEHSHSSKNPFDQIAWNHGARTAEARWPEFTAKNNLDLKDVLLTLNDSPFSSYPRKNHFLLKRATQTEIQIELNYCSHQVHFYEVRSIEDQLCKIQLEWTQGFVSALNKNIQIVHTIRSPRCLQYWTLK